MLSRDQYVSPDYTYCSKQEEKKRRGNCWASGLGHKSIKELAHARPAKDSIAAVADYSPSTVFVHADKSSLLLKWVTSLMLKGTL